jgi:methionyl aminopeptidase
MSSNRIKTTDEIVAMREGGRMLALVLEAMRQKTKPGLTPKDMAGIAGRELTALGGRPAFLGFEGYPDIICISVNNQVQHGIPDNTPFKVGDVVNYDFGVRYKGMITDAGISVCVGQDGLTTDTKRLLEGTQKALQDGLRVVKAGVRVGDISAAIEHTLRTYKLGIVRELVGHGVGHELHEEPEIPNYGKAGRGPVLRAGMTIAIEPITTLGSPDIFQTRNGWTLLTVDSSWSAQFEHTVLVTATGAEILTKL